MGCQEPLRSKFPLKPRPTRFFHAPILLLTAHAMQRYRGKKRFDVTVPFPLLCSVRCAMVCIKDKTYSLRFCTQVVACRLWVLVDSGFVSLRNFYIRFFSSYSYTMYFSSLYYWLRLF
jgi:hypothetical protein